MTRVQQALPNVNIAINWVSQPALSSELLRHCPFLRSLHIGRDDDRKCLLALADVLEAKAAQAELAALEQALLARHEMRSLEFPVKWKFEQNTNWQESFAGSACRAVFEA